jgi:glycerol 3-phosphatase-2
MILAEAFDAFFVDLDGVVYVGDEALPGAPETLAQLRQLGKSLLFLTNDPRSSRAHYAAKLRRLGVAAVPEEILTSGAATASYMAQHEQTDGRTAFCIGTAELKAEIEGIGLTVVEGELARKVDFVVIGGHEAFNYQELRIASQAVRAGARFYATNRDATFPTPDGPWPAVGAILASVETAAGQTATAIGKPEPHMFEAASSMVDSKRIAVVGDSPATDIVGGRRAGFKTILVAAAGTQLLPDDSPDFVVRSLGDLLNGAEGLSPPSGR